MPSNTMLNDVVAVKTEIVAKSSIIYIGEKFGSDLY
jgi:hypothetical protein